MDWRKCLIFFPLTSCEGVAGSPAGGVSSLQSAAGVSS